jgi:hypothetical protein
MRQEPNDPTRTGAPVPSARFDEVVFSLSEIQAACLKAARGSGLPWGLAEEIGAGAAWLAAAGLPGPELVLRLLEQPAHAAPRPSPDFWRAAQDAPLCPVRAGAALCDFAALPEGLGAGRLVMADVVFPLLILPFAAQVTRRLARAITVEWPNVHAVLGPNGYRLSIALPGAELAPLAAVTIAWAESAEEMLPLRRGGQPVAREVWERLDRLAMRTTVPATARSHADAGAAASDND